MRIAALHKTTLLDFPGKVSALVFIRGCNFHCPYCHNPDLLCPGEADVSPEDVLDFLRRRRAVLQGLVISGGEPTLQPDLAEFCAGVKALGYAVKLDTNGSRPDVLRELLAARLLDYVALDLKAAPDAYPATLCPPDSAGRIAESLAVLRTCGVLHEYRVTAVQPFVTPQTFAAMLDAVSEDAAPVYLQEARLAHVLTPDFFAETQEAGGAQRDAQGRVAAGRALTRAELEALAAHAAARGVRCEIR